MAEKPEPPEASSHLPCSSESTSVPPVHGTDGGQERVAIWVNPVPLDGGILCSGDKASSKFSFSVRLAIASIILASLNIFSI